jgi:hypothetical protein
MVINSQKKINKVIQGSLHIHFALKSLQSIRRHQTTNFELGIFLFGMDFDSKLLIFILCYIPNLAILGDIFIWIFHAFRCFISMYILYIVFHVLVLFYFILFRIYLYIYISYGLYFLPNMYWNQIVIVYIYIGAPHKGP